MGERTARLLKDRMSILDLLARLVPMQYGPSKQECRSMLQVQTELSFNLTGTYLLTLRTTLQSSLERTFQLHWSQVELLLAIQRNPFQDASPCEKPRRKWELCN